MSGKNLGVEHYPLVIQVIQGYLIVTAPDFDYRVVEAWRPSDIGQTEMLILKVRRELQSRVQLALHRHTAPPSPSTVKQLGLAEESDLLSTREVSRILRLSDETVRRLAKSGALPCRITPGGHRRFARSTVEQYLRSISPSLRSRLAEA
jgi:excisionase family DNA binding protein